MKTLWMVPVLILLLTTGLLCSCKPQSAPEAPPSPKEISGWRAKAEKGDPTAQNKLGDMYAEGQGVEKDVVEAVRWYRKAAEQGFSKAQNNLGIMYSNGDGVAKNEVEAAKWCRKAADQGYPAEVKS